MSEEERLKLEDIITSDTGKALIKEIKYNELMQQRVEILLKQNRELHSIIEEAKEYIEKNAITNISYLGTKATIKELFKDNASLYELLKILNKVGSDKE